MRSIVACAALGTLVLTGCGQTDHKASDIEAPPQPIWFVCANPSNTEVIVASEPTVEGSLAVSEVKRGKLIALGAFVRSAATDANAFVLKKGEAVAGQVALAGDDADRGATIASSITLGKRTVPCRTGEFQFIGVTSNSLVTVEGAASAPRLEVRDLKSGNVRLSSTVGQREIGQRSFTFAFEGDDGVRYILYAPRSSAATLATWRNNAKEVSEALLAYDVPRLPYPED